MNSLKEKQNIFYKSQLENTIQRPHILKTNDITALLDDYSLLKITGTCNDLEIAIK